MLKLMFQYFGHPMRRVDSFEKTLIELYKKIFTTQIIMMV